jgi:hypothetical protein
MSLFLAALSLIGMTAGETPNAAYFLVFSREAAGWERRRLAGWSMQLPKWAHFR